MFLGGGEDEVLLRHELFSWPLLTTDGVIASDSHRLVLDVKR